MYLLPAPCPKRVLLAPGYSVSGGADSRGAIASVTRRYLSVRRLIHTQVYTAFDTHLDALGVYKLDTVGDAFVVVAGLDGFKSKEVSATGKTLVDDKPDLKSDGHYT